MSETLFKKPVYEAVFEIHEENVGLVVQSNYIALSVALIQALLYKFIL